MNDIQTFCELQMTSKPKFENLRQFFAFIGFNTTYINYHYDDVFKQASTRRIAGAVITNNSNVM